MRVMFEACDRFQKEHEVAKWLNEKWCVEIQHVLHDKGVHRSLQSIRDKVAMLVDSVSAWDRQTEKQAKPEFYDDVKRVLHQHKTFRSVKDSVDTPRSASGPRDAKSGGSDTPTAPRAAAATPARRAAPPAALRTPSPSSDAGSEPCAHLSSHSRSS
jgi:hypothetical protein